MNHLLKPLVVSSLFFLASATATATQTSIEPILDKSDALTMAINFANAQPYETNKVDVSNYIITDIKDLNGIVRSYEISLLDSSDTKTGYVNVPNRAGFDAISNYAFNGRSKTQQLQQRFARQVELVELATGNKAFFVGAELGAIAIAVKLDGQQLSTTVSGYEVVGDYAVFSQFPKFLLTALTQPIDVIKNTENDRSTSTEQAFVTAGLQEENILRQKLLAGSSDLEEEGTIQTNTLDVKSFTRSIGNSRNVIEGNSVGGEPMYNGKTEYKGYNQYLISQNANLDKKEWCFTGCTPTAYTVLLDYWDRKQFPNLIGGTENREQNTIKNGGYYGDDGHKYYVESSIYNDHDLDEDAFKAVIKIRNHLKTSCNAATAPHNIWRGENYIKEMGYDAKVTRTSGLFKNKRSFDRLKREIDAGRPALIGMTNNGKRSGGHSVVAYGYKDVPGTEHDKIYMIVGLGDSTGSVIKRNVHISTTSVEISELPSTRSVKALEVAPPSLWQKLVGWFHA